MRRLLTAFIVLSFPMNALAADTPVTREAGFIQIWQGIKRPAASTREHPYDDIPKTHPHFTDITFAKYRGLLDSTAAFRPADPLTVGDAVLWLFRTRNIDDHSLLTRANLPSLLERYPLISMGAADRTLTQEELTALISRLTALLKDEVHEVSLYAEKFHGKGTAFGETFDMHAFTAAHRTFPHNTLVRVTNVRNGKSIVVRINDRGPFVKGRDMDLSLASFLALEDRSKGKFNATFERLGDASLVTVSDAPAPAESGSAVTTAAAVKTVSQTDTGSCTKSAVMQRRFAPRVVLTPGLPDTLALGKEVAFGSQGSFVVRSVRYPDGTSLQLQDWVNRGETFSFKPSVAGTYTFDMASFSGKKRSLSMNVVDCGAV